MLAQLLGMGRRNLPKEDGSGSSPTPSPGGGDGDQEKEKEEQEKDSPPKNGAPSSLGKQFLRVNNDRSPALLYRTSCSTGQVTSLHDAKLNPLTLLTGFHYKFEGSPPESPGQRYPAVESTVSPYALECFREA